MARSGFALAAVLVAALVMGVLALALLNRVVEGSRTAAWARDHLALRLRRPPLDHPGALIGLTRAACAG